MLYSVAENHRRRAHNGCPHYACVSLGAKSVLKKSTPTYTELMSILNRFFIAEWFKALVGALVALLLLVTSADIINGFLRGKEGDRVLLEWLLKMPDLTGKMLPVTCLIATLFTFNRLKSHNELIAALAAGFSHLKLTLLIATCSLTVVGLQFFNLGFLEPHANKIKRQEIERSRASEGKYLTRSMATGGQFWFKSKDYFATFAQFDKAQGALLGIRFYYYATSGLTTKIISADAAVSVNGQDWMLRNVTTLEDLSGSRFPRQETHKELPITLNETLSDFGEFEADLTTLSWFSLYDFVSKIEQTGINTSEYKIILHQKLALSLACLVFALIPMGAMYRPSRRSDSFGKNVAITLILTIGFWVAFSATLSFGQTGKIPSVIAPYLVPSAFLVFSVWTYLRNRKLAF